MTTFAHFLMHYAEANDPQEDEFIQDSRMLIELDRFVEGNTWKDVETFLIVRRAWSGPRKAARRVYSAYQRWLTSVASK